MTEPTAQRRPDVQIPAQSDPCTPELNTMRQIMRSDAFARSRSHGGADFVMGSKDKFQQLGTKLTTKHGSYAPIGKA